MWYNEAQNSIEPSLAEQIRTLLTNPLLVECNFRKPNVPTSQKNLKVAPHVQLGSCIIWSNDFEIFDVPPIEIARQLTLLSSQTYYSIHRSELLDGAWQNLRLKHRSPNVCTMIVQFNSLSAWVSSSILIEKSFSVRLSRMKFFCELLIELKSLQNYFDMFSIFSGFEDSSIYRLDIHKKQLPQSLQNFLSELSNLISIEYNHKAITSLHHKAFASGFPTLPHIPVLLGNLFKYNENTEMVVDGMINVRKCLRILNLIREFEKFRGQTYYFLPIIQIQQKLIEVNFLDSNSLLELSIDIEPEDATLEQIKKS